MTNRVDTFNRADAGSLATPSDSGAAWVQAGGTSWAVISNQGVLSIGSQATAWLESSVSDVDVQVTFPSVQAGGAADVGIVFRLADDGNYLLCVFNGTSGSAIRFFEKVSGSFSLIGTGSGGTIVAGDIGKITVNGSSITFFVNGASVLTATSSTFPTNTKHGIRANSDASTTFDDFSITGLGGGGTTYAASITETGNAADTPGGLKVLAAGETETGAAADTAGGLLVLPASIAETGGATDTTSASPALPGSASETGALTDTVTGGLALVGSMVEIGAALDTIVATLALVAAAIEAGTLVDMPGGLQALRAAVTESGLLTDTVDGTDVVVLIPAPLLNYFSLHVEAEGRRYVAGADGRTYTSGAEGRTWRVLN